MLEMGAGADGRDASQGPPGVTVEMSAGAHGWDVSQAPPVTEMWPLVGGVASPPGTWRLLELQAVPALGPPGRPVWEVHATWELSADVGELVVDGVWMQMGPDAWSMRVAPRRVPPGARYRTSGPRIGWRPEILRDASGRG